jgi:hypothetical protein
LQSLRNFALTKCAVIASDKPARLTLPYQTITLTPPEAGHGFSAATATTQPIALRSSKEYASGAFGLRRNSHATMLTFVCLPKTPAKYCLFIGRWNPQARIVRCNKPFKAV